MPSTQPAHSTERPKRRHLNFTMLSRPCEQEATTGQPLGKVGKAMAHCSAGAGPDGKSAVQAQGQMANSSLHAGMKGPQEFAVAGIAEKYLSVLLNDRSRESALQASCSV